MKPSPKKPVGTTPAPEELEPKKPKLTPVFQYSGNLATEISATHEPEGGAYTEKDPAKPEPVTGLSEPLQESIPFEEERRSYLDRRSPIQGIWKGVERRAGGDRRLEAREKRAADSGSVKASRKQLIPEVKRLVAWFAAIVIVPGAVYFARGWEASLAAFGIVTTAFLTHHFFHLNRRS